MIDDFRPPMIEAIVLAGGQGTRLRAIVRDLPKPMADIAGRPFLWWLMTRLNQQGVGRVILSVGYKSAAIQDYFGTAFDGMEISYAVESRAAWDRRCDEICVREGQRTASNCLEWRHLCRCQTCKAFCRRFDSASTDLAVAVTYLNDSARYGSLVIDEKTNTITGFSEKQGAAAGYINAGVYCLRRDIFAKYSAPAKFSFERDFLPKQFGVVRPLALKGVRAFIDIGVPEDYTLAQTLIPTLAARIADDLPGVV